MNTERQLVIPVKKILNLIVHSEVCRDILSFVNTSSRNVENPLQMFKDS